ncbi:MAG: hypothetical protein ACPGSB_03500 [Opitutales bacterium]
MNTKQRTPIIEPNNALLAYLQLHRDDSADGICKTLWTTTALATSAKLRSVVSSLWEEADRVKWALTAYVKIYLPEVANDGSPAGAFFAEMSSRIEECPLNVVMPTIEGIFELLPVDSELLPDRTVAGVAEGQELRETIMRFLANYDRLLEQLKNDSTEDWDFKKDLREYLDGKSGPDMAPAQALALKTRTVVFNKVPDDYELPAPKGTADIHDIEYQLCFDEAFTVRLERARAELEGGANYRGEFVPWNALIGALI